MRRFFFLFSLFLLFSSFRSEAVLALETSSPLHSLFPSWQSIEKLFLWQNYNTRIVILGTTLLGLVAGVLGCFTLLRKRALMGDALSHATLPGIGIAFMLSIHFGGNGKSLPILLLGATLSGFVGLFFILLIRNFTRVKEDAALAIILSVFFGLGVAILGVAQRMSQGDFSGLESFIYGKTASMLSSDAMLIGAIALVVLFFCISFFKEFRLLCFDSAFAKSLGWNTLFIDGLLMSLVIIVTVIGLQAVGLILVISLLVIPAASARFWTQKLSLMLILSGVFGILSAFFGTLSSALFYNLPSGAMIVLWCSFFFILSALFGKSHGVFILWIRRRRFEAKVRRQHLLRAIYEIIEEKSENSSKLDQYSISVRDLLHKRSWSRHLLSKEINLAEHEGLLILWKTDWSVKFTAKGFEEASERVRQHRLWELYLITHADIAPNHVDRDADAIEHVLAPEMLRTLEDLLDKMPHPKTPKSPHLIEN